MMFTKTEMIGKWLAVALSLCFIAACGGGTTTADENCGQGDELEVEGQTYCVYSRSITEEGFSCPPHLGVPSSYGDLLICGGGGDHPDGLFDTLHENYPDEVPEGQCVGVMCSQNQTCTDGSCSTAECWIDSDCQGAQTCSSGVCRGGDENNNNIIVDTFCISQGLLCGDQCIIYEGEDEPGGQGGYCNNDGECVVNEPVCNGGTDLEACLETCDDDPCLAPYDRLCAEDGNRYCSACARDCHGVEVAEDPLVCGVQYWEIAHYRTPCAGVGVEFCMYVRRDSEEAFSFFYGGIEGFEHTWGRNYIVSLDVEEIDDPPADGSSLKYTLIDIIEETPVPAQTTFDLPFWVDNADLLITIDGSTGTLGQDRAFRCEPESVCAEIQTFLTAEEAFRIHLRYAAEIDDPLVIFEVEEFEP
ncbi:MAG: DUF4377 domain-containing protein [Bradymonadaceae bacterium]